MNRYEGKKVVIIGGTSGIGLTTAKMLVDGGAHVLVTAARKPASNRHEKSWETAHGSFRVTRGR